jgi:hypothetical protein
MMQHNRGLKKNNFLKKAITKVLQIKIRTSVLSSTPYRKSPKKAADPLRRGD